MPTLFIEFAGLPGAGKTTIAREVISELTKMGYDCFWNRNLDAAAPSASLRSRRLGSKVQTLRHLVGACITHKRVAFNALECAVRSRPRNLTSFERAAQLLVRLDYVKSVSNAGHDLVIFDQGLIQYMWSISATGELPPDRYIVRLLESILDEISAMIIFVEIDVATAIDRVTGRSTMSSRFDKMPSNQAEQLLAQQSIFFDKVLRWSYQLQEDRNLTIDGRRPVKQNVQDIECFIRTVLCTHSSVQVRL